MTASIETLKALAEKATPGPWQQYAHGNQIYGADEFFITAVQSKNSEVDAAYIAAANPQAILSLIAELETARGQRDDACARAAEYPLWQNAANTAQAKAERDRADIAEGALKRAESSLRPAQDVAREWLDLMGIPEEDVHVDSLVSLITAERVRVREAARAVAQRQIDAAERNKFTVSWLSCAETIDAELRAMPLEP